MEGNDAGGRRARFPSYAIIMCRSLKFSRTNVYAVLSVRTPLGLLGLRFAGTKTAGDQTPVKSSQEGITVNGEPGLLVSYGAACPEK